MNDCCIMGGGGRTRRTCWSPSDAIAPRSQLNGLTLPVQLRRMHNTFRHSVSLVETRNAHTRHTYTPALRAPSEVVRRCSPKQGRMPSARVTSGRRDDGASQRISEMFGNAPRTCSYVAIALQVAPPFHPYRVPSIVHQHHPIVNFFYHIR